MERIIKQAARVNNSKAATGAARVLRDLMLPVILKLTANNADAMQVYGYRIDWASSRLGVADAALQLVGEPN